MDWNEIIIAIIQLIIAPLMILIVKETIAYLRQKADSEKLAFYFARAEDAIYTTVEEIQQTFVDELKKTNRWDKDAAVQAYNLAVSKSKSLMSQAVYDMIDHAIGDANTWITAKIESAVHELKG